ncbi:MAG: alanine--tRNA ligase [Gammaproteobacteria bacterium]|nr:alanine--tRNA ligase [Gammaproteobacteria bacterium]
MKSCAEIRQAFLDYFYQRGHTLVASSSLVPGNDPTLLFTNAGMVQFKDLFLGQEQRPYTRAVSSQRCVRAGGKHNDLDNVGYTARHHTFFEMLGNFSFGDYFKQEAIAYAWDFLTGTLGIDPARLWVTVYDEDDEAAEIWLDQVGVDPSRLSRIGAKDNFWSMGDTGPCGPCSEIFYDHGPEIAGGPPGTPEEDGDRYVEIWNLVFMQYDRDAEGTLHSLPKPSVDTGMGLERITAVLQGVHSNYEIDLFVDLIDAVARLLGVTDKVAPSLRVVADHLRACAFLVLDGVVPSNEGRGYVLRRIIRRAVRHGNKLGASEPFFHKLVMPLSRLMGDAYPELVAGCEQVAEVLLDEEKRFAQTLQTGLQILEQDIAALSDNTIPGETLFRLYDTYGFPVDLTADIAREKGLGIDLPGFESCMAEQRERARSAGGFKAQTDVQIAGVEETCFTGYEALTGEGRILALLNSDGVKVDGLVAQAEGSVVLDRTPFYAESGGQVGDVGLLQSDGGRFRVRATRKLSGGLFAHEGLLESGTLQPGGRVEAAVDEAIRHATALNHSATHLLHAALREVLGEHVSQKGSLVDDKRLRFDFSHGQPVTPDELRRIELLVNAWIRRNQPVETRLMAPEAAIAAGAMALFGEKYGREVRVLSMGDFSVELCGGTHASRTGDIALFKLLSEGGVAAGVRRIEAVAGGEALSWVNQELDLLDLSADLLKVGPGQLPEKLTQLLERNRQLERDLAALQSTLAQQAGADLATEAEKLGDISLLARMLPGAEAKNLRETVEQLRDKLAPAVVVLVTTADGKVNICAGVSKSITGRVKAGDLVAQVASQVGGKGGGRADMAMGGGSQPENAEVAVASVKTWVEARLQG